MTRRPRIPAAKLRERGKVAAARREDQRAEPYQPGWLREAQTRAGNLDPASLDAGGGTDTGAATPVLPPASSDGIPY